MNDKNIVDYLLCSERQITGKIHSAIEQILSSGYFKDETGKKYVASTIDSIRRSIDDLERALIRAEHD